MKKKGETIDLGVEGVSAELSPDGQSRVIMKLHDNRRLFTEPNDRNVYAQGAIKRCAGHPGTVASQEMGLALVKLPGVNRIQFRRNEGVFVDIDIQSTYLKSYLRRVARELLLYAQAYRDSLINPTTTNP